MAILPRRPEVLLEPALESDIPDPLPRSEISFERWLEAAFERTHPQTSNRIDIIYPIDSPLDREGVLAPWGRMMRSIGRFYGLGTPAWSGFLQPIIENQVKVNVHWPPGEARITIGNLRLPEPSVVYTWSYMADGDRERFKTILFLNVPDRMLEETRQRLQEFFPERSFPKVGDIEKLR